MSTGDPMKVLKIRWQRLVDETNRTCDRCGSTGAAVERAVEMLGRSLKELGIEVELNTEALDRTTFDRDPMESNRIWVGGLPIEWWLSGTDGKSQCCSVCGDAECRTLTVDGRTYEAVPVEMIVKAGLLAAARIFQPKAPDGCCASPGTQQPGSVPPASPCGCR